MPYFSMAMRWMPKPKAKPVYRSGIVAAVLQHHRMHHAAAADLQPAATANCTALSTAQETFDVELGGWFGEREERSPETGAGVLPKQTPGHIGQRAFQVAEGDAGSNRQAFQLVELGLMAGVRLLVAVAHPRQDDTHGRRVPADYGPNTPRMAWICPGEVCVRMTIGIVAASLGLDEIGILHVACRMADREVEQLEVVFIALDLAER